MLSICVYIYKHAFRTQLHILCLYTVYELYCQVQPFDGELREIVLAAMVRLEKIWSSHENQ